MPLDSLINPDHPKAAVIPGYGPLPAELARDILTSSQGRKWWRRLFTAPCNTSTGSGRSWVGIPPAGTSTAGSPENSSGSATKPVGVPPTVTHPTPTP